jgi:aspartyl-tRNA(Asn)/glutamyl-tRNA(Gln) amidotransferase subunit A
MGEDEIVHSSALELARRYREREVSPVEVVDATLARIERLNPSLNAFVTVTVELAREQARIAEERIRRNADPGPLTGIPVSVKDLTPTKGIRTTRGSLLFQDWVPDFDAPLVERIYDEGAVLLGKTNTPEFGWKGDSGNRVVGPTHNPWGHGRTAGGSSGGAAAAVAASLGPLAQGTDGAGSVRIPACFCGVFGLKPSFGLVPYYPASALEPLSHNGPITRTVRDAALLLDAIARPDARDRFSLGAGGRGYLAACEGGISGWRVAWSPDLGYAAVEDEVAQLTAAAAKAFSDLGADVEEVDPRLGDPYEILDVAWSAGQAAIHAGDLEQVRDRLDPGRLALINYATRWNGVDVAATVLQRADFYDRARVFMDRYDLLLTPTLPVTAFPAGEDFPRTVAGREATFLSWTPFTYPFNLTGQPAATVPCGSASDGLPVGLQIVGRVREDGRVLRAAAAFEEARPWAGARPDLG